MAYAVGTATDWMDFLRKLRDYISGALDPAVHPDFSDGGEVPVGQRWDVLVNGGLMTNIPGSGFATDGEVYFRGPGSDPTDEIIVGIKTYRNEPANVWGWSLRGFTQFDDSLSWTTLPGLSPECYAAFDDESFPIWIWCNARRVMAAARVGTSDILVHFGFIQQFGTRNQYPYPLLVAGSANSQVISFQTNHYGHSCLPDPSDCAQLRWVDGTWITIANYSGSSQQRGNARLTTGNVVWPNRNPIASPDSSSAGACAEDTIFESFTTGVAPYISDSEIGAVSIFPACLVRNSHLVGRIDGLFAVFGFGLVTGDTLTDNSESPPVVYDVFANTWRSEPIDYFAVRRE